MPKLPIALKLERKKLKYHADMEEAFRDVDVRIHMLDVLIYVMRAAELHFYKRWKKTGHLKREAVKRFIMERSGRDEQALDHMIESIHPSIQSPSLIERLLRFIRKFLS